MMKCDSVQKSNLLHLSNIWRKKTPESLISINSIHIDAYNNSLQYFFATYQCMKFHLDVLCHAIIAGNKLNY